MTIALLVRSAADEETILPVATEAAFLENWAPGAMALGLKWLPLFPSGVSIIPADLPEIIDELRRLRQWLETEAPEAVATLAPRLDGLLVELEPLQREPAPEMFIG